MPTIDPTQSYLTLSGHGGVFTLRYTGRQDDRHTFEVQSPGFKGTKRQVDDDNLRLVWSADEPLYHITDLTAAELPPDSSTLMDEPRLGDAVVPTLGNQEDGRTWYRRFRGGYTVLLQPHQVAPVTNDLDRYVIRITR